MNKAGAHEHDCETPWSCLGFISIQLGLSQQAISSKDRHDLESAQIHESELPKLQRILFPSIHRICIVSGAESLNINLETMVSGILLYKTRDWK